MDDQDNHDVDIQALVDQLLHEHGIPVTEEELAAAAAPTPSFERPRGGSWMDQIGRRKAG